MSISVLKFGGTSVANHERIDKITDLIKTLVKKKKKIIVVVSAMSGVTNKLVSEFNLVSKNVQTPEYDSIISIGEQYSSSIVCSFLKKKKINARSILGWQIPIKTDSNFSRARITSINSNFLERQLRIFDVLIIAGFQGVDDSNYITTLGRGGSDTSAVAVAVSIGLNECEIYTDVDGIFTADPKIVKNAKKISFITYEEILEMASLGSKVLHPRSVELAMKYGITVHVRSSFKKKQGTFVVKEEQKLEEEVVTGIASSESDAKITLKGIPDKPGIAAKIFSFLANAKINVDMIVQNVTDDGKFASITFTVPLEDCENAVQKLKKSSVKFKNIHLDKKICKVSIVGVGMKSNVGVAQTMFETLAKKNINIQVISTSEIKISVLISVHKKKTALEALHKAYSLDR
ncbi:MAG: Aspartate kinase Ask_LysC [Alphaproteobacteria bacterium MarineAlpha8_Bin1]|nr:MAG: Aspartate kinase Ask_LysC [Alphaproteobacteria bacterium MarineAlpha8_Bin1]|tara:strand:+ start:458 stop:1669 length:1212 start_codon:yes stop_codon:yes gene_type:complete